MIKRFESNVDAVTFLSKIPESELKNYRIGTDKKGHIIAEKNTWFNSSWLGRAINRRKGDQLDASGFFNATKIIVYFANLKISPNVSDKRMEWIQNAKKLQEPLLIVASNVFAKDGAKMHQLMENLKPESAKKNEVELTEGQTIEDEKLTEVQREVKSKLLDQWENKMLPELKKTLIKPIALWKEVLGGMDHREVKQRYIDKSSAHDQINDWDLSFNQWDSDDKKGVEFFSDVGFDRFAETIKELHNQQKNSLQKYAGQFKYVFEMIEQMRGRASDGKDLTSEETALIQKFYKIRDKFFKKMYKHNQAAIENVKNNYLKAMNETVEKIGNAPFVSNLEIKMEAKFDTLPIIMPEMEELSKELSKLQEDISNRNLF